MQHGQFLADARTQARDFLTELANLRDELEAVRRFHVRFTAILEGYAFPPADVTAQRRLPWYVPIIVLRQDTRKVWEASSPRDKEYLIFSLREMVLRGAHEHSLAKRHSSPDNPYAYLQLVNKQVPPEHQFEQISRYFLTTAKNTKKCQNPECPAPYFFATRRSQRFCGTECAKLAQRESKRKWWRANGPNWRKARAKKRKQKTR